jgi:hypothetical protein
LNKPLINGKITAPSLPGQFNYDYVTSNGVCPDDTANILLVLTDCQASLDDLENTNVSIYPNPSSGMIYISGVNSENTLISIQDLHGRKIRMTTRSLNAKTTIELMDAAPGMYVIVLEQNGTTTIKKLTIE